MKNYSILSVAALFWLGAFPVRAAEPATAPKFAVAENGHALAPIVISASIDDKSVEVSPRKFGAGPITLVISNQSTASQQVTLETEDEPGGKSPGEKAIETGPINPRETASVKGDLKQGTYTLHVGGDGVRAAKVVVGKQRPSSQNDLLQP